MDYKDYQCDSQGIELNELEELFEDARYNNYHHNHCDNHDHHNHCDRHDRAIIMIVIMDAVMMEEIVVRDLNQNQFLRKELLKYNLY